MRLMRLNSARGVGPILFGAIAIFAETSPSVVGATLEAPRGNIATKNPQIVVSTSDLPDGNYTILVSLTGPSETISVTDTFKVDTVAPLVSSVLPSGQVVGTAGTLSVMYSDAGSGILTDSVNLQVDGSSLSGCTRTATQTTCPLANLAFGNHVISGTLADKAGNIASINGGFTVVQSGTPRTIVSLTFDDGRASQVNAGQILANYGFRGTFYVNSDRLGTSGYYMTLGLVRNLAAAGNEIGGHTLSHIDLTTITAPEVAEQVCRDQEKLQGWGFPALSFAYPYGAVDLASAAIVGSCKESGYNVTSNYLSARRIGGLQCSGCPAAESFPLTSPYTVRTPGSSVTNTTTLSDLQNMVLNAEASGGWIEIPFHSVCSAPSYAAYPGNAPDCSASYAVSYSILEQFVAWLVPRTALGTVVLPALEAIGLPLPPPPPPPPPSPNLVQNPSFENDLNNDGRPDGYLRGGFGTNSYTYARVSTGARTGNFAEQLTITSLTSGNRKVVTAQDTGSFALLATPSATYRVGLWYKSTIPVRVAAYYREGGVWRYWTQSPLAPASSDWTQLVWTTPAMPASADLWSFGASLEGVGSMTVDDFSATKN